MTVAEAATKIADEIMAALDAIADRYSKGQISQAEMNAEVDALVEKHFPRKGSAE